MSIGHPGPLPPLAHWKLDEAEGMFAYNSAAEEDGIIMTYAYMIGRWLHRAVASGEWLVARDGLLSVYQPLATSH